MVSIVKKKLGARLCNATEISDSWNLLCNTEWNNFQVLKIKNNRKLGATDRQDWLISLQAAKAV